MAENWSVEGDYLEACTCRGACPCLMAATPTEGDCRAIVGWHVAKGRYGDAQLDGLNVAVALHSPGNMVEGNWDVVLYLDAAADESQKNALAAIFGGQAGGHPAVLASFIGKVLGVEQVPIRFEGEGRRRAFRIGDAAEAAVEALEGQGGAPITLQNHPVAVAPGQSLVVAKSSTLRHHAYGIDLALDGRTAYYSPFAYAGP